MEHGRTVSNEVDERLTLAVEEGEIPGAVLLVSSHGNIVHERAYGDAQRVPLARPMELGTLFDVASLTKVLGTTLAFMRLTEMGLLSIDDTVSRHLPEYRGAGRDKVTLSDLLTHGSGLPAWKPFYKQILDGEAHGGPRAGSPDARAAILKAAVDVAPEAPRGERVNYSDVGFLVLTAVIEKVSGMRLDRFCEDQIFKPLDLRRLFFLPQGEGVVRRGLPEGAFAATEHCPWRNRVLVGEVSDDNAHAMGGVAGHAGLFGSVQDIHAVCLGLLEAYNGKAKGVVQPETLREFWRRRVFRDGRLRSYGWDVPSPTDSQAGRLFSNNTFGHLGYTGTSLWIDADRDVVVILLTNRTHPSRTNEAIRLLRPAVHDLVMTAVLERPEHREVEGDGASLSFGSHLHGGPKGRGAADKVGAPSRWQPLKAEPPSRETPLLRDLVKEPLEAVWIQCKGCQTTLVREELNQRFGVCPRCGFHHVLTSADRVRLLVDDGTWEELDLGVAPTDPLTFVDTKPYPARLAATQKKLGLKDAIRSGRGQMDGIPVHLAVFDFQFLGGSMGSVVGEKVTRTFERALEAGTPAVVVSASGGARMQEGVLSLMQMSKTCAALAKLQDAGLAYISILCHPTTGGVAASFAMLGDVNIAEPGALIGFAGPRVIEQTIRQKLPEGFQRSEFLLEHGMVDVIVERGELKRTVSRLLGLLQQGPGGR